MAFGQNIVEIVIKAKDQFSTAFNKAGLSMQNFRKSALAMGAIGGAIAFGLKKAVDTAIELESAMVGVRKTTGLSAEAIKGLTKEFVDLSKVMPLTATELAQIGEVAGQLGITGVENIKSFTTVAAKMSIATELSAEDAALAMAKISNAMGLPISEAEKLGSAINELSNVSASSSTEIISAMVRVAGSARTLGLSTEVVAGLTAALIASGEPAERAGTKLRSAFDQVVKKMEDEVIPLMGSDFPDAIREDANGAILSLIKRISQIEDPIRRQQKAIDIFGTVGASAINKLSNNLPEMNRLIGEASAQFENATSLQEEYDIASQSTANQIKLMKNSFAALQLEIAEALMPAILPLIKGLTRLFEWFSSLPKPVKEAITLVTAITAGVLLLGAAVALVTVVASPWLAILLGIGIAIGLIIVGIKNLSGMIGTWDNLWLGFKNTMIGFANIFLLIWNGIVSVVENSINILIGMVNKLIWAINLALPKKWEIPEIPDVNFKRADMIDFDFGLDKKSGTTINIDNVIGMDPEDISRALSDELGDKLSL